MAGSMMGSPRTSPRPRVSGGPVTLGNLGSMLPRPQAAPIGSPVLPERPMLQPPLSRSSTAPDTRSGVVYERDGFEVFYGLTNGGEGEPAQWPKAKADGYDKFYGIRSNDKIGATGKEGRVATEGQAAPEHQGKQRAGAIGGCQSASKLVVSAAEVGRVSRSPKVVAPSAQAQVAQLPSEVPTYSVSTPAAPYVPPIVTNVPSGVHVYSVATPMPPPPGRSHLPCGASPAQFSRERA